jgi:hypothetical protein
MKNLVLFILLSLSSAFVFAHGEDKAGPNGGFVRMPGSFHTELVLSGKNKVKIYLLDIHWKNPSVLKSKVELTYKKTKAVCETKENFFSCEFPKTINLTQKGELKLIAERDDQKGMEVSYPLPLKLSATPNEHSGHH